MLALSLSCRIMDLLQKVRDFIASDRLLNSGDRVVVGVSGGADSIALLFVLQSLGYDCLAVHCNFHLRGDESDRDMNFVESLCRTKGIRLIVCNYDTRQYALEHKCSIEMAARELRYSDFERIRQENDCAAVAVAHHRDDSVETVLMNLIRGTGIRGLAGIRCRNGNIVRPLLCVSRTEIEQWLAEKGQPFVTDSTNLECDYTRNKIRLQLLPMMRGINPDADAAIARTSARMKSAMAAYLKAIEAETARCVSVQNDGTVAVSIVELQHSGFSESLLFEILTPYGFNETQIGEIAASLSGTPGRSFMAGEYTLIRDRESLLLKRTSGNDSELSCSLRLQLAEGAGVLLPNGRRLSVSILPAGSAIERSGNVAMLDCRKLKSDCLTVRSCRPGDAFVPFGMRGRKLLSDFMTDARMSLFEKRSQLLLCDGEDIVWVIGRRTDNRYRVDPESDSGIARIEIV